MFSQTMQFAVDWMNQCEMCVTRTLSTVDVNRPAKSYFWPTTGIKSTKTCVSKFMCIERLYYKKKKRTAMLHEPFTSIHYSGFYKTSLRRGSIIFTLQYFLASQRWLINKSSSSSSHCLDLWLLLKVQSSVSILSLLRLPCLWRCGVGTF